MSELLVDSNFFGCYEIAVTSERSKDVGSIKRHCIHTHHGQFLLRDRIQEPRFALGFFSQELARRDITTNHGIEIGQMLIVVLVPAPLNINSSHVEETNRYFAGSCIKTNVQGVLKSIARKRQRILVRLLGS